MTKIDIISGFLGAGKTTLIKKLLAEAFPGEKLVLIENEFGEISIDGGFLKESGIQISEMSSGCICCSLVGDFGQALKDVQQQFAPDRILIEPSGVGKLSDVIAAVQNVTEENGDMTLNSFVTVADASKVKVYMKNFGEFYNNQVEHAGTIILSRTQKLSAEKLDTAVKALREKNPDAAILTTPWDQLSGETILSAIQRTSLADELLERIHAEHHHHHEHDEHCTCGCHDHEHHHDHDHEHHHHEHDEHCTCGCHDHEHHHHDHHGHHHADEVFTSWGVETVKAFGEKELSEILEALEDEKYGVVLRAKGIIPCADGGWLHFDYTPGEQEIRRGGADFTGRLCVIGSKLDESAIAHLFGV